MGVSFLFFENVTVFTGADTITQVLATLVLQSYVLKQNQTIGLNIAKQISCVVWTYSRKKKEKKNNTEELAAPFWSQQTGLLFMTPS